MARKLNKLIRVNTVTDRIEQKLARKITYVVFTPITNNTKSNGGDIGIFGFAVLATF